MDDFCFEKGMERGLAPNDTLAGPPSCMIPGNADFYGFGVRIGIYLTWISSWIANNFVASEMAGSLDTNSIFLLALALTVSILSAQKKIWVIDSNILLQLSFGFMLSVMTIWGRRTAYHQQGHFGGWGTHFRLLLCAAVSGYSLWFWIDGVVDPNPNCFLRESCDGLRWFMFANVRMSDSWMRTIAIIVSAVASAYYGTMLLVAIAAFARSIVVRERWNTDELEMRQALRSWTLSQVALATVNLLCILYTMLGVEFTLNFNNVAGVLADAGIANSAQLTPLLVGTLTSVRLLWVLYKERWAHPSEHQAAVLPPVKSSGIERPSGLLPRLLYAWLPWLSTFHSHSAYGTISSRAHASAGREEDLELLNR